MTRDIIMRGNKHILVIIRNMHFCRKNVLKASAKKKRTIGNINPRRIGAKY